MKKYHSIWLFTLSTLLITCRPNSDDTPPPPPLTPEWEVFFTVNPAGVNPLCAKLDVEANIAGRVKIEIIGQDGEASNITHTFSEAATSQSVPILGLYSDYENIVNVSLLDGDDNELLQEELRITTDPLPPDHPVATIVTASLEKMEPGLTLISNRSNPSPNLSLIHI